MSKVTAGINRINQELDKKSIITATDYKRFQKRAEAVIRKYLEEVQEKNTLISEAKKGIKFFAQGYGEGPDRF